MNMKLKIMMPCSEAAHISDKSQYNESSLWEKIKLFTHILYCLTCRNYVKANERLSLLIKKSQVTCLDKRNKEYLKINFQKALTDIEIK